MKTSVIQQTLMAILLLSGAANPLMAAAGGDASGPAQVDGHVDETALTMITLTSRAEERLALKFANVERKIVTRKRLFPGEITLPLRASAESDSSDETVSIFSVKPPVTRDDLIGIVNAQLDADGLVENARVKLEATELALERAEQLLSDKVGSARAVDDAKEQYNLARVGLETAQSKRNFLGPSILNGEGGRKLWVRVPVFVGDLSRINVETEADVVALGSPAGSPSHTATPVQGMATANSSTATADLFYELSNESVNYRLGQRVEARLQMAGESERLVIPWSAVTHDVNGGTWVYENLGNHKFSRRRVQVAYVDGANAVLANGPERGTSIVTEGVAELFGTEFEAGH